MSYRCPARPSKYRRQAFTDTDRHQTQSGSIWSRESEACSASSHSSFSSTSRKYHRLLVSRTSTRPSLVRCHQFLPSLHPPSLTVYGSLRGRSAALVALFQHHLWPTGASRFCLTPVSALFQSQAVHARCLRRSATSSGSHLDLHYSTLLLTHSSPERPPTLFYYYFPSA